MADIYQELTVGPAIPKDLVTQREREIIDEFFTCHESAEDGTLYLYSEDYCGTRSFSPEDAARLGLVKPGVEAPGDRGDYIDIEDAVVFGIFQEIIKRSEGRLKCIWVHGCFTCSKPRMDEFGGFAVLITADGQKSTNTWDWLLKQREALAGGRREV